MYSVVMMLALSGATEAPEFGRRGCHCSGFYHGCYGCHCHGSYCHGCFGWRGCHGCYGCHGCCGGVIVTPVAPVVPVTPLPAPTPKEVKQNVPATITVQLPANAKLFFDGQQMKANSASRVFTTPPLQAGRVFYYTVKAEMDRDGQKVATTHTVQFRAGQSVLVAFDMSEAGTLTARQE